jgi:hypothetical protein
MISNSQVQFPKTCISDGTNILFTSGNPAPTTVAPAIAATTPVEINISASGSTVLVAGSGTKSVRVYRLFLVVAGATNITFKDNAGTPVVFTGAMPLQANGSITLDFSSEPWFTTTAGAGFVINSSNAVQISGALYQVQS